MCKYSACKGAPAATVMCKHLASNGAFNSNYNVKFHGFKEATTAIVICMYLTFKRPPTTIVMFKYLAFKGATNSNCNVQLP